MTTTNFSITETTEALTGEVIRILFLETNEALDLQTIVNINAILEMDHDRTLYITIRCPRVDGKSLMPIIEAAAANHNINLTPTETTQPKEGEEEWVSYDVLFAPNAE